eukprot:COSAG06_NODE_60427_length_271_cov_0.558140_1_plen_57_part_10
MRKGQERRTQTQREKKNQDRDKNPLLALRRPSQAASTYPSLKPTTSTTAATHAHSTH